jgi:hypothetical protein
MKKLLVVLVIGVVAGGAAFYLWMQRDPLHGKTGAIYAQLDRVKTRCEGRAKKLLQAGVRGEAQYDEAVLAANGYISYLQGVLDSRGEGDEQEIERGRSQVEEKASSFLTWADDKLPKEAVQEKSVSPLDVDQLLGSLKLLSDTDRRKEVKKTLGAFRLRTWQELSKEAGEPR